MNTILYYNEQFEMKYGHLVHLKFCWKFSNFQNADFQSYFDCLIIHLGNMPINNVLHDFITYNDFNLVKEKANAFWESITL